MLSLASARSQTVVLQLRGGDRLTGTITAEDTNRVVLSTKWAKEMVVPLADILKREPVPTPVPVAAPTNAPSTSAGTVTNTMGAARPGTAGVSGAMPEIKAKPPHRWAGEAQIGADLAFSERKRQLYSGRLKATYLYEKFRNIFDYTFTYAKTDGLLSDNHMFGSSKTDFELSKRIYVYNLGGAGYDEIRKIDIHYEVGPGFGYRVLKLTNFVFNTELGVNYQAEDRSDNTHTELFFYRLAENATWALSRRISFDEKVEFFPRVEDFAKYRLRLEANARYALRNNLAFVVSVLDAYDTQPAIGVGHNDLQLRSSISLKF